MKIDAGLRDLIPPLSTGEREQLEVNLVRDGCLDPLRVWGETLLDGHHRYAICTERGIPFETREVELKDRDAAMAWVIQNQFGRRNLTAYVRGELALKLKPLLAAKAKENQRGGQGGALLSQNSVEAKDTQKAIAQAARVSHDTIARVEFLDARADEQTKAKLRTGEVTINAEYQKLKRGESRAAKVESLVERALSSVGALFPVLYADPPWRYEHAISKSREIENQYPTMDLGAICALDVWGLATDDAVLFLWATSPKLAEALTVLDAWGFTYKTCMVWDKEKIGMGYYARQQHELLLIATVGSPPTPEPKNRPGSVVRAPRGKHSAKPDEFYEIIEAMYPELPKVELFARRPRKGWSAWGNEGV